MIRFLLAGFVFLCTLANASSLQAAEKDDMFQDEGFAPTAQPPPGNPNYGAARQSDMFRTPPPSTTAGKDVFDGVSGPENPGIEDEFSAHRSPPAATGIFDNSQNMPPQ